MFHFQIIPSLISPGNLARSHDSCSNNKFVSNFAIMALNVSVKVHPVVLFQIVDAYERRNVDANRVIGTLLGIVDKGVVEVTNSFCLPHIEDSEKVLAELRYAADMLSMLTKINKQEKIVGWWATGHEVTIHSNIIHEYYSLECQDPIHLTLDTTLQDRHMGMKAYMNVPVGVPKRKTGSMFTRIPVEVTCYQPEIVGIRLSQKTANPYKRSIEPTIEPTSDLGQVGEACFKMNKLIDKILSYVEDVLADKVPANDTVGRALLNMVHSVPQMTPEQFEDMFNSSIKDLLMVITLAQLTRTQLQLNEKLTLLSTLT